MKLTSWRRVERQEETTQNKMDWTSQEAHPTSNFLLSQTNRFLLLFKPVWAVFSIIAKMIIHPPDILLQLRCSVLQVPEQKGRVWSDKILSWHRWYVTAYHLNSFSWGGGKIRQVHLQTCGEGVTSQSVSKGTDERISPALEWDPLRAQRAWAARGRWGRCSLPGFLDS